MPAHRQEETCEASRSERIHPAAVATVLVAAALPFVAAFSTEPIGQDRELATALARLATGGGAAAAFEPAAHPGGVAHGALLAVLARVGSPLAALHVLQIAVHVAATAFVVRLARGLGSGMLAALVSGLVFGLHPTQVEAVAWASAAPLGFAAALSIVALERHVARGHARRPWGAWIAAALAPLFHPVGLLVFPALVVTDRAVAAGRPVRERARTVVGYAAALATFAAVVALTGRGGFAPLPSAAVGAREVTAFLEVIGRSAGFVLAPFSPSIARPFHPERGLDDGAVFLAVSGAVALAAVALVLTWRNRGTAAVGVVLVASASLAHAAGLGGAYPFVVAERALVLGAAGVALLAAAAIDAFGARGASARSLATATVVIAAIALGVRTSQRLDAWSSERDLWLAEATLRPDHLHAQWQLGAAELERHRARPSREALADAFERFSAALDIAERASRREDVPLVTSEDVFRANLGFAWCLVHESDLEGFGDRESPVEYARQLAAARPSSPEVWFVLGVARFGARDDAGATEALSRATSLDPRFAEAHRALGLVELRAGRVASALPHFERALALRPTSPDFLFDAARVRLDGGDTPGAVELAERLRRIAPQDPRAYVVLATARARQRDFPSAIELLTRALERDPTFAHAHSELGKVYLALGREADALESYRAAVELGPTLFEPHYNLAVLLLARGLADAALPLLERAYELGADPTLRARMRGELALGLPPGGPSDVRLALVDLARGDAAAAESWIARRLSVAPGDVDALVVAARAAEGLGRLDDARSRLERAVASSPDRFQPAYEFARFLERRGDEDRAREVYAEAVERLDRDASIDPQTAAALRRRIAERLMGIDD